MSAPRKIALSARRSKCPVACTLDLIGDKWTLLVVRDLLLGRSLFKEFQASPEGIATNILSDRLARLVASELAETYPSPHKAGTRAYRLSRRGRNLEPVVRQLMEWGLENIRDTGVHLQPAGTA